MTSHAIYTARHKLFKFVHVSPQRFIKPWADHIALANLRSIFNGVFPLIGKIIFGVVPIRRYHHGMAAWHLQTGVIQ